MMGDPIDMPGQATTSVISSIKQARNIVLVPNRRAYELCLAWHFQQAAAQVLIAPAVEVWSRWVEQTAARIDLLRGAPVAGVADQAQLELAWQQAIRAQPDWTSAYECQALARSARAADRLLRHWLPAEQRPWLSPAFQAWRQSVEAGLQRQRLFTPEDWMARLRAQLEHADALPLQLPASLELRGFVEITRLERSLLEALRQRGTRVIDASEQRRRNPAAVSGQPVADEAPGAPRRVLHAFDSAAEEWRAAAAWAAQQWRQGKARIAVVVNGLAGLANELQPVFDRVIHPQDGLKVALTGDSAYHLADGGRLSHHAAIGDALLLLRLAERGPRARQPFADLSRLLLSPHVAGWAEEAQARAAFELELRAGGLQRLSLQDVCRALAHSQLDGRLSVLRGLLQQQRHPAGDTDTAGLLHRHLSAWGWPGPVAGNSLLAGRVKHFIGLLERLRKAGPCSLRQGIASLSQWCRDTRFTERGGPLSPIQLVGMEDAVGQRFDAAWVCNVHDGNWPGRPAANPFLPACMSIYLPRATPQGELDYSRRVQQQLDRLAPEVHYSWSRSGDDVPRLASPLVAESPPFVSCRAEVPHWPVLQAALSPGGSWPAGYAGHPWLRAVDDQRGRPLGGERPSSIPGGSAMLSDQSACPMMAYLRHRVQLRLDPMPGPFADYAYRGSLLHQALYQLFREQAGRPGLPAASSIAAAVDQALASKRAKLRLTRLALRAERQRLERLLLQWLGFERQRQGFTVLALEREHRAELGGLELHIRMDRVDRLQDGRQLIVDYKSGAVEVSGWLRERIAEPQLPLYAVLLDRERPGSVAGVALASVRSGDCAMAGVVDDPLAALGALYASDNRRSRFGQRFDHWQGLLEHWKKALATLLDEIGAGHAGNCVYQARQLSYAGLDIVLRRSEGEAWLAAHGHPPAAEGDEDG